MEGPSAAMRHRELEWIRRTGAAPDAIAMRWGLCPIIVVVLMLSPAVPTALATSVIAKSFASICSEADEIFIGTVAQVRPYRRENGRIWTAVLFEDTRWLAGDPAVEKELQFAGGRIGDRAEVVGGMPRFKIGQRVVLFVRDGAAMSPIVGFHQGCFGVREFEGVDIVLTLDQRPVLRAGPSGISTGEAGVLAGAISLEDFAAAVADARAAGSED